MKEVRWDLIRRLREQIASGNYETAEKLEVVVDRLLAELEAPDMG